MYKLPKEVETLTPVVQPTTIVVGVKVNTVGAKLL